MLIEKFMNGFVFTCADCSYIKLCLNEDEAFDEAKRHIVEKHGGRSTPPTFPIEKGEKTT